MKNFTNFSEATKVSRRAFFGVGLSALVASGVAYKAFGETVNKKVLFVSDPNWVSQPMLDRMIHYAGGASRLREYGFTILNVAVAVGDSEGLIGAIRVAMTTSPSIVVAIGDDEALAMHEAFPETPLVFWCNADPTGTGLVRSFRAPGGHATGATSDWAENVKPLEFLSEVLDRGIAAEKKRVGIFCNGDWFSELRRSVWSTAANELGFALEFVAAESFAELIESSQWKAVRKYDAVVMPISTASVTNGASIVGYLKNERVLSLFENFTALTFGAPLGYEHIHIDWPAQLGQTLGLIAQGVHPSEIPVRGPEGWEYAVNKSALADFGVELSAITSARIGRVF